MVCFVLVGDLSVTLEDSLFLFIAGAGGSNRPKNKSAQAQLGEAVSLAGFTGEWAAAP